MNRKTFWKMPKLLHTQPKRRLFLDKRMKKIKQKQEKMKQRQNWHENKRNTKRFDGEKG